MSSAGSVKPELRPEIDIQNDQPRVSAREDRHGYSATIPQQASGATLARFRHDKLMEVGWKGSSPSAWRSFW